MMEALLEEAGRQATDIARVRAIYRDHHIRDLGRMQLNCAAHGAYLATGIQGIASNPMWEPCPACVAGLKELRQRQRAEAEQRQRECEIAERIEMANVPPRFLGKSIADYKAENDGQRKVVAIATDFVHRFAVYRERGDSLVFGGRPGTGKTLLAAIVLQEVCRKGFGARYTTCSGLVQSVRATWGKDGEGRETDVLDTLCGVSLLAIDEIGAQAGTENEKEILCQVIDRRYSAMRPTILATNLNKAAFQQFVGDRIWDRLTEVARWIPFSWESYRPRARREYATTDAAQ